MTTYSEHAESLFSEDEEMDLAAELLGVNNEHELDQFLGGLLRRAASAVGGTLRSPTLTPLGGLIKGAVRRILPRVGRAFSGFSERARGGHLGPLAADAGQILGMEGEGLSAEDQEFAAAKQLVRLAGSAAAGAAASPPTGEQASAARQAVIRAAQAYAPGLLQSNRPVAHSCACGGAHGSCSCRRSDGGSWSRHGRQIILHGV